MNYISNVIIENFQSHEFTELDFTKGLNVITGPSDQGKSAILRAIKWALFNEPRGTEFIRHGANYARVTVKFNNETTIIRERSSSKNRYSLIDADGESQIFEGFGNEIPQEIINTHGIPKVAVDSDIDIALNISDQLESPFLLFQTSAVRAKVLGQLIGAHVIDFAIRNCITDIRRETQSESRISQELKELDDSISDFSDLGELKNKIDLLEVLTIKIKDLNLMLKKCMKYNDLHIAVTKEISGQADILHNMKAIDEYEKLYNSIKLKLIKLKELSRINKRKQELSEALDFEQSLILKTQGVNEILFLSNSIDNTLEALRKNMRINNALRENDSEQNNALEVIEKMSSAALFYEDIYKRMVRLGKLDEFKRNLALINSNIAEGQNYLSEIKNSLNVYTDNFIELMKKIGKCPMCLNDIDDSTIDKISLNYKEVEK